MNKYFHGAPPASVVKFHNPEFLASIKDNYDIFRQLYEIDLDYPELYQPAVIQYTPNTVLRTISTGLWVEPLAALTYAFYSSEILAECHHRVEYEVGKGRRKRPICVFGCHFQYYLITPYGVVLPGEKNGVKVTVAILPEKSLMGLKSELKGKGPQAVAPIFSLENYIKTLPGRMPFNIMMPTDAPNALFAATHLPEDTSGWGLVYRSLDHDMYQVRYKDPRSGWKRQGFVAVLKPNPKAIAMLCAFTYRATHPPTAGKSLEYHIVEGGIEEQIYEACKSHRYSYPCTNRMGHVQIGRMVRAYYESEDWKIPRPISGL